MKKVCSDKAPLKRREWSVTTCYQRGLKAGFVAGLKKAEKTNLKKQIQMKTIGQTNIQMGRQNLVDRRVSISAFVKGIRDRHPGVRKNDKDIIGVNLLMPLLNDGRGGTKLNKAYSKREMIDLLLKSGLYKE